MIQVNWPSNVNTKFYAGKRSAKENVELSKNLSGRVTGHKINSKDVMQFSVSLTLTKAEQRIFWNWYNNNLCQTAGYFYCAALDNNSEQLYRFTSKPDVQDTDQRKNEFQLEIEEAF